MKNLNIIPQTLLQTPYSSTMQSKVNESLTRDIVINAPCLAVVIKIAEILYKIDYELAVKDDKVYFLIKEHLTDFINIICLSENNDLTINQETYKFMLMNITVIDICELLQEVIFRFGILNFQKSIISSLQMSLLNNREIIARYGILGS